MKNFLLASLGLPLIAASFAFAADAVTPAAADEAARFNAARPVMAEAFFRDYLNKTADGEIRCVWFQSNDIMVGMEMTMNLRDYSVYTAREVFDWATQGAETRPKGLTHPQTLSLQAIVPALPPSQDNLPLAKCVAVAVNVDGKVKIFQYDRVKPPPQIRRLYDIGGDYIDLPDSVPQPATTPPPSTAKS